MKVIRPITITDAMLIASDVAEPSGSDPSVWSSGTTYALGDTARSATTHRIYKSKQGANTNHDPTSDDGTWWTDVGGVARWAMFDPYVSTPTSRAASLTVTIAPGVCDGLFLYGMVGTTATVTMTDGAGGPTVYSRTLDLLTPVINDWYSYYFDPYRQVPYFVLYDLPPYVNGRITLAITGTGTVSCGMMVAGRTYNVGDTKYGIRAGIRDYSKKEVDEATGFVRLTQGRFAKTLRADVRLPSTMFAEVHDQLEQLRATPCVWIGDSDGSNQPLTVFGFYRDFYLTVDLPTAGLYTLEIEGMV